MANNMQSTPTIHLGFELGTGKAVHIPLRHTAVTGQTQESGKTTTLEAMINRSGLRAVCFVTKRGERSFSTGRAITPYFYESADWQFVESILEATMRERMKFQRSWIMKLCEANHTKDGLAPAGFIDKVANGMPYEQALGIPRSTKKTDKKIVVKDFGWTKPKTLVDVADNIEVALLRARGLNESVYRELREYLRIVIPQIKNLPKSDKVDLKPGINVMWLDGYSLEMQALIIRSVLEWITEKETRTVTVIPEAWQHLRQDRSSPVLLACEHLIRQGAANQNFIWLDSQDIAGVHKSILRQVAVWILGVQREIHETERTLDHMPGGIHKPKLDEIMKLGKGQFFVAYGDSIRKTYVWPVWMSQDEACLIAYSKTAPPAPPAKRTSEDDMFRERAEKAEHKVLDLQNQLNLALEQLKELREQKPPSPLAAAPGEPPTARLNPEQFPSVSAPYGSSEYLEQANDWLGNIWPLVRDSIVKDPLFIRVATSFPEIEVAVTRRVVEMSDDTLKGKIAVLISEGFFDEGQAGYTTYVELKRRGASIARPSVFNELNALAKLGFVTIEKNGASQAYRKAPGVKVTKREISNA